MNVQGYFVCFTNGSLYFPRLAPGQSAQSSSSCGQRCLSALPSLAAQAWQSHTAVQSSTVSPGKIHIRLCVRYNPAIKAVFEKRPFAWVPPLHLKHGRKKPQRPLGRKKGTFNPGTSRHREDVQFRCTSQHWEDVQLIFCKRTVFQGQIKLLKYSVMNREPPWNLYNLGFVQNALENELGCLYIAWKTVILSTVGLHNSGTCCWELVHNVKIKRKF